MAGKEEIGLSRWLVEQKGFGERGARDVECRLRRAVSFDKRIGGLDAEADLGLLERKKMFKELVPGVRSQLRRAVILSSEMARSLSAKKKSPGTRKGSGR